MSTKFSLLTAAIAAVGLSTASASIVSLDFEGLGNLDPVGNFYSGIGVTFSDNALAIVDEDAGGTGNIGGEPSPDTVLFFLNGPAATLDYAPGFTTGFSFYYSAINNPGFVNVYDGPGGTGNILATIQLPTTPFSGAPDPTGQFSPFFPIGVAFAGTAYSIDFGGTVNQIAFDNITFGSQTPVGTPDVGAPLALLGLGLVGLRACRFARK
jgi:hypothetical protein